MTEPPLKRSVTIRMPAELAADAEAVARAEDRSVASLIRTAIRRYVNAKMGASRRKEER